MSSLQMIILQKTAHWGVGPRGRTPKTFGTEGAQGSLTKTYPNNTWGIPGIDNCGGPISQFFFGHRFPSHSLLQWGCLDKPNAIISVILKAATGTLCYFLEFPIMPVSLTSSGEGYAEQGPGLCFHKCGEPALLTEQNVSYKVWTDGKTVGQAQNTVPVIIKLKDPHLFSHQKQYSLKPEVNEWAKSYCTAFS